MNNVRVISPASSDPRVRFAMIGLATCKALFWHDSTCPFPKPIEGASCFILKLGDRYIGVTASHVVDRFLVAKRLNPNLRCQLMHVGIDLEGSIISRSASRDIATFGISPDVLDDGLRPGIIECRDWRPPIPPRGAPTMFVGYPEGMRTINGPTDATFKAWAALDLVEDATEREIVIAYDPARSRSMLSNVNLPPPDLNLSGCSGGPALAFERRGGEDLVHAVGVIVRGPSDSEDKKGLFEGIGVVRASRMDCVLADGTIDDCG